MRNYKAPDDVQTASRVSRIPGNSTSLAASAASADTIGRMAVRYGLVGVLLAIGAMKFTACEAEAISGLVSNSPLLSWTYNLFSVRGFPPWYDLFCAKSFSKGTLRLQIPIRIIGND